MTPRSWKLVSFFCLSVLPASLVGPARCLAAEPELPNPFFAFDNGLRGIADPPALLKELGYDGMGASGLNVGGLLKQYQDAGLKMYSTYVGCNFSETPPYDPQFAKTVEILEGTGVILWLTVRGGKYGQDDERAVAVIREIADLAAARGVQVALYPHTGFYVATTADALRLAKQANRPNLGVSINLCHELMTDQGTTLDATIREAAPHLMMVSINGADAKQPGFGWDRLIQPLGRGDYDVAGFLRKLREAGYEGPIGLQCYAVPGDAADNLRESINAWKKYQAQLVEK
ncbi:MAG: sugar phosphate isomerase/epimerase [Pirellulaceae bacterium]|nr:sugar phosphate isomerase/epimerase [Pirellulaceae bacterium]